MKWAAFSARYRTRWIYTSVYGVISERRHSCLLKIAYYCGRVVRGSNFFNPTQHNPTHQTTDPTQPNPLLSKIIGPTNQPNPQPITQSNSIQPNQQTFEHKEDNFNIITVSESLSGITHLLVFIVIRLLAITLPVTRGLPVLDFFGNVSDPRPNPHQKTKRFDPIQTAQPNPTRTWIDPTHR